MVQIHVVQFSALFHRVIRVEGMSGVPLLPPPLLLLKGRDEDGVVVAHLHAPLVGGQRAERDVRDGKVVPLQRRGLGFVVDMQCGNVSRRKRRYFRIGAEQAGKFEELPLYVRIKLSN